MQSWVSKAQRPDPCNNLYEFVLKYGVKDQQNFLEFDRRKYLIPLYKDINPKKVLMTASQMGKTTFEISAVLCYACRFWGEWFSFYFPDFFLAQIYSRDRFKPMVNNIPDLAPYLGGEQFKKAADRQNNTLSRQFGLSLILFLSVQGKTATEGLPLKGIFFDEIREMTHQDLARAMQRVTGKEDPIDYKMSTAGYPDSDIDLFFKQTDQKVWVTNCDCNDGVDLADKFPDCVGKSNGTSPGLPHGEYFYYCPKCIKVIADPLDGQYIARCPGNTEISGYHFSKILSPLYSATKLYNEFLRALSVAEFIRSAIGRPYVDKSEQIVTLQDLRDCEDYPQWEKSGKDCVMGVDSMSGYNVVVIKKRLPNGRNATVHLEVIIHDNPWIRTADLMRQFGVITAIVDQKPNLNEAIRFGKMFKGKVWLAYYAESQGSETMIDWKDRVEEGKTERPSSDDIKYPWMARIDRFQAIEWSLKRFCKRGDNPPENSLPPPKGLTQNLPKIDGRVILSPDMSYALKEPAFISEDVYYVHLQKIVKKTDVIYNREKEDTGQRKTYFVNVGIDPHFVHANLFADLALERRRKLQYVMLGD